MSILATILADKVDEVKRSKLVHPLSDLTTSAAQRSSALCLASALRRTDTQTVRVIAEFKRASPSAGAIRANAVCEEISAQYEKGGASAISVLTDKTYFDGELDFLSRVKNTVAIPVLRKDFIIDPYQIVQARAHGADAVLLIVSALSKSQLAELYECVRELGMRALVEVHDEDEAIGAVELGAEIIGVNHRNLATFEIDLGLTARLSTLLATEDVILVGESGIRGAADIAQLRDAGAHAVLIGETLMRAEHPGDALRDLLSSI